MTTHAAEISWRLTPTVRYPTNVGLGLTLACISSGTAMSTLSSEYLSEFISSEWGVVGNCCCSTLARHRLWALELQATNQTCAYKDTRSDHICLRFG